MTTTLERPPPLSSRPGRRGDAGPPRHGALGLAPVPPGVAPAAPDPGAHRRWPWRPPSSGPRWPSTTSPRRPTPASAPPRTWPHSRAPAPPGDAQIAALAAPFRPGRRDREPDLGRPRLDRHLRPAGPEPRRPVRPADALAGERALPQLGRPGGPHPGPGLGLRRRRSATPGTRAARPARWWASSRTPRACSTSSPWWCPARSPRPTTSTVLFNAARRRPLVHRVRPCAPSAVHRRAQATPINPETIVLALATLGMLLIVLVAVGGFTVLAQRRLRSIGMLGALGATDGDIAAGGAGQRGRGRRGRGRDRRGRWASWPGWPTARTSKPAPTTASACCSCPWLVVGVAMVLAVVATYIAASRPARAITRVPIVVALSGRPAPPKQLHRSAMPGVIALVAGVLLMVISGSGGTAGAARLPLVLGLVALIVAIVLLAPFCVDALAEGGALDPDRRAPGPAGPRPLPRPLGLGAGGHQPRGDDRRDHLGRGRRPLRQRARLRRAQPRLEPAHRLHADRAPAGRRPQDRTGAAGQVGQPRRPGTGPNSRSPPRSGPSHAVTLESANATLLPPGSGAELARDRSTSPRPQLLRAYRHRPGLGRPLRRHPHHATRPVLDLEHGPGRSSYHIAGRAGPRTQPSPRAPRASCWPNPVIVEESALPSGTSAPNTVITEAAVRRYHLQEATLGLAASRRPSRSRPPRSARHG